MGSYGVDFFHPSTGTVNLSIAIDNRPPTHTASTISQPSSLEGSYRVLYKNDNVPQPGDGSGQKHTLTIRLEESTEVQVGLIGAVYSSTFKSLKQLGELMNGIGVVNNLSRSSSYASSGSAS